MIGMNQIKKRLLNGILIGLGIGLVFVILTIILTNNVVKSYEAGTNKNFLEHYTGMVATFNRDIIQGEKITPELLVNSRVHIATLPSDATSPGAIIGKIAKYNIPRNVALINSMFSDSIIGADVRIQEISTILLPTNVAVNDYVDIKIMYPSGIEYIVIPQIQIKNIIGQTIWLDLSEEKLLIINSAMVDSYMTPGSKLYAVQYTDPTTQIKFNDSELEAAKEYIHQKIVKELNGVIKTAKVQKEEVEEAINTVLLNTKPTPEIANTATETPEAVSPIEPVNPDLPVVVEPIEPFNPDAPVVEPTKPEEPKTPVIKPTKPDESKTPVIPEIKKDILVINSGTLKVDDLLSLVTKYAIEYRYYVESYNKVKSNYQPNYQVMAFMKTHENIVDQAKAKLSETLRKGIENNIKSFESTSGESYDSIITGIAGAVESQKALRSAALSAQSAAQAEPPVLTAPQP